MIIKRRRGPVPIIRRDKRTGKSYMRVTLNGKRRFFTLPDDIEEGRNMAMGILARYGLAGADVSSHTDVSSETVWQICDAYLRHKQTDARCSTPHYKIMKYHLGCLCGFAFTDGRTMGIIGIGELQPEHLAAYLEMQSARGWSPGYCRHAAGFAKAAMRYAVRAGLIQRDPWTLVPMPPKADREMRILSPEELDAILNAAGGTDKILFTLLYETGARPSEIARARWQDIHGDKIVLQKHKTSHRTGRPRVLHLSEKAQGALAELTAGEGLIFPNSKGGVLDRTVIRRKLKAAIGTLKPKKLRNQLADVTPYTFRHTRTTRLVEAGIDAKTVSEITGNSVTTLLKDYTWPTPEHVRRAVER